jgi:predicted RNase H-like nuclease
MDVTIIGIDCATKDRKVGLALGRLEGTDARIEKVALGHKVAPVAQTIAVWAKPSARTLLALDAPLGWPADLGAILADHTAGDPIDVCRDNLFGRETDRFVYREVGQKPLEVGANLIARTAHCALERLQQVRELTGQPIPLAWHSEIGPGIHAIEVYPAATLKAYLGDVPKYRDNQAARRELLDFMAQHLRLPEDTSTMKDNADALDAAICVLAAVDFLRGKSMEPKEHMPKARKEGWIWVRG